MNFGRWLTRLLAGEARAPEQAPGRPAHDFTDALLETIEVGIVSCDAAGVFVDSNRAEREMFGLQTRLEGLGPDYLEPRIEVFDTAGRALGTEQYPLMRALRGEDVSGTEVLAGPAGGPYRELVVRGRQITGPDGRLLGAVAALTDVTSERAAARELAKEHQRLVEAQRLGQLGHFEHDFATGTWTFSEHLSSLWGVAPTDMSASALRRLIIAADREAAGALWATACRLGGTHQRDFRIRRGMDGAERVLRSTVEVELDLAGRPVLGRGTHLDITELTAAEQAAQRANTFFHAVLSATPDYTFVTDLASQAVIYASPPKGLLGLSAEALEALGPQGIAASAHLDDRDQLRELNTSVAALKDGQVLQLQARGRHADGQWRWLSHRVTPFRRDHTGRVVEVLTVVRDVTEVIDAERHLVHHAHHDYLTGLPNRALLIDRLEAALAAAGPEDAPVAVLFCDLDGFKHVNDTAGHSAGDAALVEVARRLVAAVRDQDTVSRVGGDEFVIIVEPGDHDLAHHVADRVRRAFHHPVVVDGVGYPLTVSIGVATGSTGSGPTTADTLLREADAAMYAAKNRSKDQTGTSERRSPRASGPDLSTSARPSARSTPPAERTWLDRANRHRFGPQARAGRATDGIERGPLGPVPLRRDDAPDAALAPSRVEPPPRPTSGPREVTLSRPAQARRRVDHL